MLLGLTPEYRGNHKKKSETFPVNVNKTKSTTKSLFCHYLDRY